MNSPFQNFFKCFFRKKFLLIFLLLSVFILPKTYAQSEVMPWGNITGIRVDGQLMEFESRLTVVEKGGIKTVSTGKEKQRPKYSREGNTQIVSTRIDSLSFTEKVQDLSRGKASVDIQLTSTADTALTGTYFTVELPQDYAAGSVQFNGAKAVALSALVQGSQSSAAKNIKTVKLISLRCQLIFTLNADASFTIKKNAKGNYTVYLPIQEGAIKKGETYHQAFTLEATGEIDKLPITLNLNTAKQGRAFAGFGGNFRIQNPKTDPQVIDYSLQNLRVAMGRVEMPWRFWQPEKSVDPTAEAKAGKLDPRVQSAMEMAQRLGKMNIPVILTAWSPPDWAIVGKPNFRPTPEGVWGNPLDKNSMPEIYKSITDYILYLKANYGVEVADFSFNESDLGINIRQTGQEHAELIKGLGAYFASKGLKTKLLLGDNSDATTYEFIYPAMKDPATKPYIGAVSFHSWRGWETETLQKWADAAAQLNLPLIVGEGSTDAAAYNYPAVFAEPTYALQEINLYVRMLAICQPLTILQWQLTADYSPLAGGGIFGDNGPLRPTQRFWNLKQLAATPQNVFALPIMANRPNVTCAALGNHLTGIYSIQLVNNGTTRQVTLIGLPAKVKALKMLVTDQKRAMQAEENVTVTNGKAVFNLDMQTYTTLTSS